MATLLHLDSSLNGDASHSRAVTAAFRTSWEKHHPEGTVVYRDLAADPLPHLTATAHSTVFVDPAEHTREQREAYALRSALIKEIEQADALLIGAPMYNYTIGSTLKAWIDHVLAVGTTAGVPELPFRGKPTTVVASRGGSYAPGTPQEGNDYVQNYLEFVLGTQLGFDLQFIVPELTLAPTTPAMASLVPLAEASRTKALEEADHCARTLAGRFSA